MWSTILTVVPVATLVSIAVSLIVRWLDRPRPRLAFESQFMVSPMGAPKAQGPFRGAVAVINIGDGIAYDVEVYGDRCDAAFAFERLAAEHSDRYSSRLPQLAPGATVIVRIAVDEDLIDEARLLVRWDQSPGRPLTVLRRRFRDVRIRDVDVAMPFPVGMMVEREPIPRHFRRWRDLAKHTERGRMQRGNYDPSEDDVGDN
jgi:hypothetical protein